MWKHCQSLETSEQAFFTALAELKAEWCLDWTCKVIFYGVLLCTVASSPPIFL